MKQTSRPPAQYVVAPGSQFRLVPNDYDKNRYAQCHYTSQRTLMRCKQIRSKDDLAKRGGICEEHTEFSKLLITNHKKEVMRCHAENDTKMQRRRFDPWITTNEHISDEDDYLHSIHDVALSSGEWSNNSILDNHPLRNAKIFTEKDVLRIKMDLVQKDIDDLMEFKRRVVAHAQNEYESMESDEDCDDEPPKDMAQRRVFNASRKYAKKDYLTLTQTIDPVYKQCCVGPAMTDKQVVDQVVADLLDRIDGKEEEKTTVTMETQCQNSTVPTSEFCFEHILLDRRQKMFVPCVECGTPSIRGKTPKCSLHIKECWKSANQTCTCSKCAPEKPKEVQNRANSRAEINIMDDDEGALGNLSRIETMASPMQQFPSLIPNMPSSASSSAQRRYHGSPAQLLRPMTMGPPPGQQVPYQKPPHHHHPRGVQGQAYLSTQEYREQRNAEAEREEEAKSLTCARVRPVEQTQYGEGKKKLQQKTSSATQRQSTPYHHKRPQMMTSTTTTMVSPPGGKKMTFQGWKNQAAASSGSGGGQRQHQMYSGSQGFGPTRYPIQHNRHQPPPPPKQIPLERIPDHHQDPLIPDDSSSPTQPPPPSVRYPQVDPQQRGVPYYKNAAYRRTELPTSIKQQHQPTALQPSTSTSGSQLLLGPPSQSTQTSSPPKMYHRPPPHTRLPMAPHRAIAAGLNPADMAGGFSGGRSVPHQQQQQQYRMAAGGGGPPQYPNVSPQHQRNPQNPPQHHPQMYPHGLQSTPPRIQNPQNPYPTSSGAPPPRHYHHVGTPLPPISLPRRAPEAPSNSNNSRMGSFRVQTGGPNGPRTTHYHPGFGRFGPTSMASGGNFGASGGHGAHFGGHGASGAHLAAPGPQGAPGGFEAISETFGASGAPGEGQGAPTSSESYGALPMASGASGPPPTSSGASGAYGASSTASGGAPTSSGAPGASGPPPTPSEPPGAPSRAVNAVVTALDSARHDSRFANINVRTFLSMGQMGQKDLSKMSQEEIEQMAAETEQEKVSRKATTTGSSGSSASSGGGGGGGGPARPYRTSFGAHGASGASSGAHGASPGAPPPHPRAPRRPATQYIPDSVKEVVSSMMASGAPEAQIQNLKRKLEHSGGMTSGAGMTMTSTSSGSMEHHPGEPQAKRMATEEMRGGGGAPGGAGAQGAPEAAPAEDNPLDLLAELSAAAEAEEDMTPSSLPPSIPPRPPSRKTPKKTSSASTTVPPPRRPSGGKKKSEEREDAPKN